MAAPARGNSDRSEQHEVRAQRRQHQIDQFGMLVRIERRRVDAAKFIDERRIWQVEA